MTDLRFYSNEDFNEASQMYQNAFSKAGFHQDLDLDFLFDASRMLVLSSLDRLVGLSSFIKLKDLPFYQENLSNVLGFTKSSQAFLEEHYSKLSKEMGNP